MLADLVRGGGCVPESSGDVSSPLAAYRTFAVLTSAGHSRPNTNM